MLRMFRDDVMTWLRTLYLNTAKMIDDFFPTRKDVYNHIYNVLGDTRANKNDQVKVAEIIDEWRSGNEGSHIFFRPMSETDQLLVVIQSDFQKALLCRYGEEICILDSTYNTTKYTVSLSFVCVKSNVGYQVVATFILAKVSTANITEVTEELLSKLITDLLVYKRDEKYPVTGMKSQSFRGLNEKSALAKVFQEFKTFGSSYIMFIILKEILIKVACNVTGETYTTVEENCLRTEVNINQIAKAAIKNK